MISQVIFFSNVGLHINKHAGFDENFQSLLGYTDIAIYLVFNWSYYIGMAMGAFKSRESYEYFAHGQVRDLQAWLKLGPSVTYLLPSLPYQ